MRFLQSMFFLTLHPPLISLMSPLGLLYIYLPLSIVNLKSEDSKNIYFSGLFQKENEIALVKEPTKSST